MTGFPVLALILLLLPLAAGAVVLELIGIRLRDDRLGYCGWAYLAGSLALALVLFAALAAGLDRLPLIAGAVAALALAGLIWRWRVAGAGDASASARPEPRRIRLAFRIERGFFALVVGLCLLIAGDGMIRADSRAVIGRDEAHIWAAKAKVLYVAGGLGGELQELLAVGSIVYHRDYPLLSPLLQLGSFAVAGRILHVENRVPIQGCYLALIVALAAALRRVTRPALAAGLLFLVVTAPASRLLIGQAYADHLVALGLLVTVDAWWRYRESGSRRWWRLAVVALTFTAWSKNEGLMLAVLAAGAALPAILRRARDRPGRLDRGDYRWLLLPAGVVASQLLFNLAFGLGNDLVNARLGTRLLGQLTEHAPVVARHFLERMLLDPPATQLLFALFFGLLILFPRRLLRGEPGRLAAVVLAALAVDFTLYVSTYHDLDWHLATSSGRVLFQLIPALALWLGAAAGEVLPALRARP